ncbi:MAG: glycosyltransferase [Erysipelotrichales bacterium]|nr:glycosyltransferase [Erysipelotrichales bacterium]
MNTKKNDENISSQGSPLEGKIGLFIDDYFPIVDGVVRVVDNYASQFAERNIPATVFCPRCKSYDDSKLCYPVQRVASLRFLGFEYPVPTPKLTRGLKRKLLEENYSLFHIHSPFFMGRYALKIARKKKIPVIATFHSKFYDDFLQITKSKTLAKWLTRYVVKTFEKCDEVWAVNESSKNTLLQYGYKGNVSTMENGTHFDYPTGGENYRKDTRNKLNLGDDELVLLFVGHLIWQKNIHLILDSLKILKNEGFKFKMIFVGEGGNEKQVHKLCEKLELNDQVTFLGAIKDKEELQKIYACADLFYFPSLYDTFSLVLREASVMKIPSLLAKDSNCSEKVIDNYNGYIEEPTAECMAKRIKEICLNKEQLRQVGENASKTIPVPWNKVIDQVVIEYNKTIKNYYSK